MKYGYGVEHEVSFTLHKAIAFKIYLILYRRNPNILYVSALLVLS